MKRPAATALGLLVAIVVIRTDARAETAPTPAAEAGRLEEVIVTAQRREQSAQEVGIALTPLSGQELADRGIASVNAIQRLAPSLNVIPQFGGGQPQFIIRGVGFADYATLNSPTVGVYVDEVAYPIPVMTQGELFDLERVEVLRGPQGTLYGRNTTGGAINFITAKPSDTVAAGVSLDGGRYSHYRVEGFVSGPVTQGFRVRLSAVTDRGGAWQHNRMTGGKLGDADRSSVRAIADLDVSESFRSELTLRYGRDQSDGAGAYLLGTQHFALPGVPALPADTDHALTGWGTSAAFARLLGISTTTRPFRDNTTGGAALRLAWQLPVASLTSITSYDKLDRREYNDWDGSTNALSETYFGSKASVSAEELRLASSGDAPDRWLAGFYYSREKLDEKYYSDFMQSIGLYALTPYSAGAETKSIFGQNEYRLNDSLNLVVGLRYEDESRHLDHLSTTGVIPGVVTRPFVVDKSRYTQMRQATGKLEVEYRPVTDAMLYVTLSRGVKSGGFTAYNTTVDKPSTDPFDPLRPFRPETLWSYELGVKSELSDHRLQLNAAVFYYDYKDQQVLSVVVDPANGPIGRIVNAPKSEIYGGELELLWKPVAELRIRQALGYAKGKYTHFLDVDVAASSVGPPFHLVPLDRSGQELGFPKLTYSGSISYSLPLGPLTLEPEIALTYRDTLTSVLVSPTQGHLYDVAPYGLVDARVTLAPRSGGPWTIGMYGNNIANKQYDVTRNFFLPDNSIGIAGMPATYGARFTYRY
jgi:iron complex outermembrane receptor protein